MTQVQQYPTAPLDKLMDAIDSVDEWYNRVEMTDKCREILEGAMLDVARSFLVTLNEQAALEQMDKTKEMKERMQS